MTLVSSYSMTGKQTVTRVKLINNFMFQYLPDWPPKTGGRTFNRINLSNTNGRNCIRFSPLTLCRSIRLIFRSFSNCSSVFIMGSFCSCACLDKLRNFSKLSSYNIHLLYMIQIFIVHK